MGEPGQQEVAFAHLGRTAKDQQTTRCQHARLNQIFGQWRVIIKQCAEREGWNHGRGSFDHPALSLRDEGGAIKALLRCVGRIPLEWLVGRRHEDGHRLAAHGCAGARGALGIVPARRVAVRPDQHLFVLERRPVGFVQRCFGTVHCGGGNDACANQGIGTLFTLDEDHGARRHQRWQVVKRAWIGGTPHPRAHIPRPELFAGRGVVAVDAGDQFAIEPDVVPLGGVRAKFIHRNRSHVAPGPRIHRRRKAKPLPDFIGDARKVLLRRQPPRLGPGCDQVAAIVISEVLPQPAPGTIKLHHQALARRAINVTHIKLVAANSATGKQVQQHRLEPVQQTIAQCLRVSRCFQPLFGGVVVVQPDDVSSRH